MISYNELSGEVKDKFFFKKEERLTSRKQIRQLFDYGLTFNKFPFKVFYLQVNEQFGYPAKVLISIPKRTFRKAVTRNLLKRRVREAYRLNKSILYNRLIQTNKTIILAFLYIGKEVTDYRQIENKMIEAIRHLGNIV